MSIDYKYLKEQFDGTSPTQIVAQRNNPALPSSIIDKIVDEFTRVNGQNIGDEIWIPILPPFHKKYENLFSEEQIEIPTVELAETCPEPEVAPEPTEVPEPTTEPQDGIHRSGKLNYRTYPYTFLRPGETIEAVIRLYNDMNISRAVINKLVCEFTALNPHASPPKFGQTAQIPVLLPFCFRHENDHKIFTDE
jgi:hypothetical protein